jgi:ABC-type glutathione transport system ATPase component
MDPFFNINTPADLARAETLCSAMQALSDMMVFSGERNGPRIIGLVGWSGSGKTTLLTKLIPLLVGRA